MDDKELERFLEDEKLAMVLQNEEFMRELRHNKDFMLSLRKVCCCESQITASYLRSLITASDTKLNFQTIA